MMSKTIAICNQKGGVSKCLYGEGKILLSNGKIEYAHQLFNKCLQDNPIVESIGEEVYLTPRTPVSILAIDENLKIKPARITKLYRGRSDTLYSILTERGNYIAVTPEHPLISISGGRLCWVKASGLKKGNFIATARTLPVQHKTVSASSRLSDQISIILHKETKEIIGSYLEQLLQASPNMKDKLLLFLLQNNNVVSEEIYRKFQKNLPYRLLRSWLAKRIVVRKRYCSTFVYSLNRDFVIDDLLNNGINSKSFDYLTSLNIISYDDIIGLRYQNRFGKICDIFHWNTIIDQEIARCIAIIIAEGSIYPATVIIHNKSKEIISLFEHFCSRFNLLWRKEIVKNEVVRIAISRAGTLAKILDDIFEIPRDNRGKSHRVKVPNVIMEAGNTILSSYLSAYLDCESYISSRDAKVEITSANEENIRRLQYAFLRFGITSSISYGVSEAANSKRSKKRTYFTIRMTGVENIRKIYIFCCPTVTYKKKTLEKHFNTKANTNVDIIPINKVLREVRSRNLLFQNEVGVGGTISDYECFDSLPSRSALGKVTSLLENRIEEKEFCYLKTLSESDIFWDKIKSIRPYKYNGYVYDLTVDKHHNFICGDGAFISHNTTTAINLSSYFALHSKNTLLIDLDPQSNATTGIGIDKHSVTSSIYNVLHEHTSLESIVKSTQIDNLKIAPSNLHLTGAEVELVNAMSREYRLKKSIEPIKASYDFILVDCPPSLGLLTVNALTAADSVLIPIQCEYYALEGLSQLMNTVNLIRDNLNNDLTIEGVLLTMADYRTNLTKEVIEEVKKFFGDKVYKTIIPRSIKLTEAPGFGKPIALYDKDSIGAQAYQNLAKEVLGEFIQPIENKEVIMEDEQNAEEVR